MWCCFIFFVLYSSTFNYECKSKHYSQVLIKCDLIFNINRINLKLKKKLESTCGKTPTLIWMKSLQFKIPIRFVRSKSYPKNLILKFECLEK